MDIVGRRFIMKLNLLSFVYVLVDADFIKPIMIEKLYGFNEERNFVHFISLQ